MLYRWRSFKEIVDFIYWMMGKGFVIRAVKVQGKNFSDMLESLNFDRPWAWLPDGSIVRNTNYKEPDEAHDGMRWFCCVKYEDDKLKISHAFGSTELRLLFGNVEKTG